MILDKNRLERIKKEIESRGYRVKVLTRERAELWLFLQKPWLELELKNKILYHFDDLPENAVKKLVKVFKETEVDLDKINQIEERALANLRQYHKIF